MFIQRETLPQEVFMRLLLLTTIILKGHTICIFQEISKKFEEHVRGTVAEVIEHFTTKPPKGEFVLVVQGLNTSKK